MPDERITLKPGGHNTFDKNGTCLYLERASGGYLTLSTKDCIEIARTLGQSMEVDPLTQREFVLQATRKFTNGV